VNIHEWRSEVDTTTIIQRFPYNVDNEAVSKKYWQLVLVRGAIPHFTQSSRAKRVYSLLLIYNHSNIFSTARYKIYLNRAVLYSSPHCSSLSIDISRTISPDRACGARKSPLNSQKVPNPWLHNHHRRRRHRFSLVAIRQERR
jgi:hypothetical protein